MRSDNLPSRLSLAIGFIALLGLGVALTTMVLRVDRSPGAIESLAVLSLRVEGATQESATHLAEMISEVVATRLTSLPNTRVTPWTTSRRYSDKEMTIAKIARDLRVDALLLGSVREFDNKLVITVALVDTRTEFQKWGHLYEVERDQVAEIPQRISMDLALQFGGSLTQEGKQELGRSITHELGAFEILARANQALFQLNQGSNALARELYDKAIELDPGLAEAYVGRGATRTAALSNGWGAGFEELRAAERDFDVALQLDPSLASAYRGLIRVYSFQGRDEKCLQVGEKATAKVHSPSERLLVQAEAYHFGSLFENAIPLFRQVLELDHGSSTALFFLSYAAWASGDTETAIDAGESFRQRFGDDAEVLVLIGWSRMAQGDTEAAWRMLDQAVRLTPGAAQMYLRRHQILKLIGRHEDANRDLESCIQVAIAQKGLVADGARIVAHALLGHREEATRIGNEHLRRIPDSGPLLVVMASMHTFLGDAQEAVEYLRQAVKSGHRFSIVSNACATNFFEELKSAPNFDVFKAEYDSFGEQLRQRYGPRNEAPQSPAGSESSSRLGWLARLTSSPLPS